jgi:hypothetical protein
MVGKPNFPVDYCEKKSRLRGAAMVTSGLDPLDQEREASMADEGGASGAVMETQDSSSGRVVELKLWRLRRKPRGELLERNNRGLKVVFGLVMVVCLAGISYSLKKYLQNWPSEGGDEAEAE